MALRGESCHGEPLRNVENSLKFCKTLHAVEIAHVTASLPKGQKIGPVNQAKWPTNRKSAEAILPPQRSRL